MKYAGIIKNDLANGNDICVSFWTQGCPIHCEGCHNQSLQDFEGGQEFTQNTIDTIIESISANGIMRNFSILGGEPLCDENLFLTCLIIREVRKVYPDIKIFIWTGYTYEYLISKSDPYIQQILDASDYLIDGPYIKEKRDITLKMRGSTNQRIIDLTKTKKYGNIIIEE